MYTYNIDGTNYTFDKEIGEEEARRRVTPAPSAGFRNRNKNPRYEGFFTEAGEGVVSGLSKIPEGIISTGTLISDAITGNNATGAVEAWFDNLREEAGIDPEGAAGKVTEALVQFGIPGISAASAISKVGKTTKFLKGTGFEKPLRNIERRRRIREGGEFFGFNVNAEEPTTGREYTAAGEIFRAFTGLQTQVIDREKILQFTGQEFKGERSSAATLFSDALRLENPTDSQMLEAYIRADDARLRAFRKMKLAYDDFKKMGLRDFEIRKILKQKAGLGNKEISSLQRDRYRPYKIDKKKRIEARRKGIKIPMNTINRVYRNRNNLRLTPQPVKEKSTPDIKNILNNSPINAPELPPMTQNVAPQQTTNVAQNTINNELFRTDPRNREIAAFLGSNLKFLSLYILYCLLRYPPSLAILVICLTNSSLVILPSVVCSGNSLTTLLFTNLSVSPSIVNLASLYKSYKSSGRSVILCDISRAFSICRVVSPDSFTRFSAPSKTSMKLSIYFLLC